MNSGNNAMRKLPAIFILLSIGLCTCVKPPTYPIIPHIDYNWVSRDTVAINDTFTIDVKFTDGDGDLGTAAPGNGSTLDSVPYPNMASVFDSICTWSNTFDLIIVDSRTHKVSESAYLFNINPYQIPVIPSQGNSKAISGDMYFVSPITSDANGQIADTFSYYIMVRDNAGHCSNIVHTPTITLKH